MLNPLLVPAPAPLEKQPPVRPPRRRPVAPLPPAHPARDPELQTKLLVRTAVAPADARVLDTPYEPLTPPAPARRQKTEDAPAGGG